MWYYSTYALFTIFCRRSTQCVCNIASCCNAQVYLLVNSCFKWWLVAWKENAFMMRFHVICDMAHVLFTIFVKALNVFVTLLVTRPKFDPWYHLAVLLLLWENWISNSGNKLDVSVLYTVISPDKGRVSVHNIMLRTSRLYQYLCSTIVLDTVE